MKQACGQLCKPKKIVNLLFVEKVSFSCFCLFDGMFQVLYDLGIGKIPVSVTYFSTRRGFVALFVTTLGNNLLFTGHINLFVAKKSGRLRRPFLLSIVATKFEACGAASLLTSYMKTRKRSNDKGAPGKLGTTIR